MNLNLFAKLTNVDATKQEVHCLVSEEIPDSSGEIMSYLLSKPRFQEWSDDFEAATGGLSKGNVRAMHGSVACGRVEELIFNDQKKSISAVLKIVDSDEWAKIEAGVYTGVSIGGSYGKTWHEGPYKFYEAIVSEISLCDLPMLKTARFSLIKRDGQTETRTFKERIKFVMRKTEQVIPGALGVATQLAAETKISQMQNETADLKTLQEIGEGDQAAIRGKRQTLTVRSAFLKCLSPSNARPIK